MKKLNTLVALVLVTTTVAAGASDSDDAWSVSEPDFQTPPRVVNIDVDQGTWMSLDVSPDGRTIAFDLLGDIYVLPISGGQARNISAGLHWDMQPRFSPDGASIAFTSDRAGGDNIWLMGTDGSEPRQISRESFRLLNNPTWSPDGHYIAARKHFTTERSLGTGEIWLYDLRGGSGVQVVKRPGKAFQKELGEPMFAPDGEAIYYSQNVTPGDRFLYAQDSNKETFRIRRIVLATGEIEDVAGGPGGAVRPAPSPDGKMLAYVKRLRARSRLFVKNLTSGEERMLVETLDQDMQEAWAVHGLYPNMDWTPDSTSIVYWNGGQIHRVDVESGKQNIIPFRVTDTRTVYDAPRYPSAVAPPEVTTRMPRWAELNRKTGQIVFESLGRLYRRDEDGAGTPRRLTTDSGDNFELFPTISPDGRWIYYVSWNDQSLGTIRRVSARGGRSKALTRAPAHYRELAVSPDGTTLIVRLASGGHLLSPLYSTQPGIYSLAATGGDISLVTKNGRAPQFGSENNRFFVVQSYADSGESWQKLVSVTLDGRETRDIARTSRALEMRIAPDRRHLAFIEGYHVFVAPLPRTGQILTLGPDASGLPTKKVSAIGGEYARWSDARTLHWSIGPTFKSAVLDDIFSEDYAAPENGANLSLTVAADVPSGLIALTNARIITMEGARTIDRGTVLVRNNRIEAVGADVVVPASARQLDLGGKTVLPGFIDVHAHGPYGQDHIIPQQNWSALAHLALGVTTVHDPSSRASLVFPAAEYARAGLILSPRTYSTGEIVYGAKGSLFAPIENLDDALAHIRRLKAQGALSVKNYNQPRRDQRQQVVEAARREKMMVVAEGGSLFHQDMNLVADGNTGVEHSLPQLAIYEDVVSFWSQTNVGYTPTLVVGFGTIEGENYWYQHDDVWKHPILSRFVPPARLQARAVRRQKAPEEDYWHNENAAIGKQLADAGVLVHTGAHGQREGLATHWELWMLEQGGMSPLEALAAATITPAKYLGLDRDLGSIAAGKLADLVVIDGDVLKDLGSSDRVTHVMLNGRLFVIPAMNEILTGDRVTTPLYWHDQPGADIR